MYEDIYFVDAKEALKVASEQNRWGENGIFLQVCYYDGEKIESDLGNLIHLPIDNLLESLAYGTYRIPTKISFGNLEFSEAVKVDVELNFNLSMQQVQIYRNQLNAQYLQNLQNAHLDFNQPLRFYLSASSSTRVMQYVSKNIADTLQEMGYDVMFELYIGIEDASCFKHIYEYNPHVTININHLNNNVLSEDVFNFVWFQDSMPVLLNDEKVVLRKRDYIYSLTRGLQEVVTKRGIANELLPFMMNKKLYKARSNIKKEKKIVFIGSSYAQRIVQIKDQSGFTQVFKEAVKIFEKNSCLKGLEHKESDVDYLMKKYEKSQQFVENIYGYLMRDYCVEKLCTIESDYKIEVYGYGWENNPIVSPYFKGVVSYGEEISKIYNSATYGYCPGGYVLMQRTLECAFSETIPLVLDVRADEQDEYDVRIEEALELFKINELQEVLSREPHKKKFDFIKQEYSYEHFLTKCIQIIQEEIA